MDEKATNSETDDLKDDELASFEADEDKKGKKKKKKKQKKTPKQKHLENWQNSRSAVAVMQNTKQYHVHLTQLSDQKANIVIAAASIIISICVSQLSSYEGQLFVL